MARLSTHGGDGGYAISRLTESIPVCAADLAAVVLLCEQQVDAYDGQTQGSPIPAKIPGTRLSCRWPAAVLAVSGRYGKHTDPQTVALGLWQNKHATQCSPPKRRQHPGIQAIPINLAMPKGLGDVRLTASSPALVAPASMALSATPLAFSRPSWAFLLPG